MQKKVMFIMGTRPEAIKLAPLIKEFKNSVNFNTIVCTTGQHREMLAQTLSIFNIEPDIQLDVMRVDQDLSHLTSDVIVEVSKVLRSVMPDLSIVHGDTTTTLAAAMACFYTHIPFAHVEAGLRSHNFKAPFPEEFNRKVVGELANWHLAPTLLAKKNLRKEGIANSNILVSGNTVIDALFWATSKFDEDDPEINQIKNRLSALLPIKLNQHKYVLITGHRRENFGDGIAQICAAVSELATKYNKTHFLYPVHLNPNISGPVTEALSDIPNVHLIPPQDYLTFVYLLMNSHIVLTDSGGVQEEAPSLGKPVLVMRNVTERMEGVEAGINFLVGTSKEAIISGVSKLLDDKQLYDQIAQIKNPYGDGKSAEKIYSFLEQKLGL